MRKYLPILLLILVLGSTLNSTSVFAQDSVFGNLTGSSDSSQSASAMQGKDVEDYKRLFSEFQELFADFEVAYGAQRTTLEAMVLARAKEAIFAKLGAAHTFMTGLIEHLQVEALITEESGAVLFDRQEVLEKYMGDITASIEDAESLEDIILVSTSINSSLSNVLVYTDYDVARISVLRGETVIDNLMKHGNLVQAHIDASAELGGDVARIQTVFDEAMLELELAKQDYIIATSEVASVSPSDFAAASNVFNDVKNINSSVEGAQKDLKEVTKDLRYLYSQSPWMLDETKFTVMEAQ